MDQELRKTLNDVTRYCQHEDAVSTALVEKLLPHVKLPDALTPWGAIVPAMFNCNERGANLWTRDDGRIHFVKSLGEGRWLNICYTPDNYPSFEVEILQMSAKKLAAGLSKSYKGDQLQFMKMNDFTPMLDTNFYLKKFVVTER